MTTTREAEVSGYKVTIEMVREAGLTPRYTASVKCPIKGCETVYIKEHQSGYRPAAAALKRTLRTHINRGKHPGADEKA
jgi:hypothetical protein